MHKESLAGLPSTASTVLYAVVLPLCVKRFSGFLTKPEATEIIYNPAA